MGTTMARLTGFEPVTTRLEGGCSIQLSYRRVKKVIIPDLLRFASPFCIFVTG